jgi:hypothetical protein
VKKPTVIFLLFLGLWAQAQIGGTKSFRFLDVPMTARAAGNGGSTMPIWGDDINLVHSNPAALNPSMLKQTAFNYCNYVGDINYYSLAYAHSLKKYGTGGISLQAFNYGNFQGYDELGNKTNTFKASDYSINLHYAKPLADSLFNIGVALKTIISQYDSYQTAGNAIDFGIIYHNRKNFSVSLLAKNVGLMYRSYSGQSGQREQLPSNVQLGFSKKVPKAPFRVFVVYDQLLKWNLNYVSPIDTAGQHSSFTSNAAVDSSGFQKFAKRGASVTDNFFRHVTLGTEILLGKNFNLRIAYNYRRQKEFTLTEKRGASAISFGFNIKVKSFGFAYSFSKMAVPGSSHLLGLTFAW